MHPPRQAHGPAAVAEVPLQLAENRRRRVGGEPQAAVGIEAVDGLDEAEHGDLDQVVGRLAAVGEAVGQAVGQAAVRLDKLLGECRIAAVEVLAVKFAEIHRCAGSGAGAT